MEYLRRGRSQADFTANLERVTTQFEGRKSSVEEKLDAEENEAKRLQMKNRLFRLGSHIDRLLAAVSSLKEAERAGIFPLPDRQALTSMTYNYMQVLVNLPFAEDQALSSSDLTRRNYEKELREGKIDFESAKKSTVAAVNALRKKLAPFQWNIVNAVPAFTMDESGRRKGAEAHYYLNKSQAQAPAPSETPEAEMKGEEPSEAMPHDPVPDTPRKTRVSELNRIISGLYEKALAQQDLDNVSLYDLYCQIKW